MSLYFLVGILFGLGCAIGRLEVKRELHLFRAIVGMLIDAFFWPVSLGFYLACSYKAPPAGGGK